MTSQTHDMDLIYFACRGYGSVRLARKYITKDILSDLFQINDIVIVDHEGSEVFLNDKDEAGTLILEHTYYVGSEKELESDEEQPEHIQVNPARIHYMTKARRELIKDFYKPLHPQIFTLVESFFVPSFLAALNKHKISGNKEDLLAILKKETNTGIYSFDIFTMDFCRMLQEEAENFENAGLPVARPNSMNNYGVILDEIGFEGFFSKLTTDYIVPFAKYLFPDEEGATLDSHHAFIVQYKLSEDLGLDFHYDSSEVTLNVCLGKTFTGGSLYFRGLLKDPSTHNENFEFNHVSGRAILHVGKHRHGANNLTSGERFNLIVWFRSSKMIHQCTCSHHNHQHGDDNEHDHGHHT